MGNINNVTITGTCSIVWKGVDLGHTLGGIDFTGERTFKDVTVDQYGSMPLDKILTGAAATVMVTLAEGAWKQIDTAFPETSSFDGGVGKQRVDLGADSGYSLRNNDAGLLVVHPLKRAVSDQTEDINIYRAVSSQAVKLPYKIDAQKVVQVTFSALVDETYSSGRRLGHIGPAAVS